MDRYPRRVGGLPENRRRVDTQGQALASATRVGLGLPSLPDVVLDEELGTDLGQ